MAQKDLNEKLLEDYNDVFADIFNTLLFKKNVLKEENLEPGPIESIYKTDQENSAEQRRDILKKYRENELCLCSFGIENQTTADAAMPVRIMGYDYGTYKGMLTNSITIHPVTSIVLNFGDTRWKNAKSLHEMLQFPKEFKPYIENYKIRVYDIAFLSDNVIEKFSSDFKIIANFFKEKRLGKNTLFEDAEVKLSHAGAVLDFLSIFTKDNRYREAYTKNVQELEAKGETINMCQIAQGLIDKGLSQGLSACVTALKMTGASFEKTFELITKTEAYADATPEQVKQYYER